MKRKKIEYQETGVHTIKFLVAYGFAFFVVITAIGVLAYFGAFNSNSYNTNWKITLNECKNETINVNSSQEFYNSIDGSRIYNFSVPFCNQTEVNELHYDIESPVVYKFISKGAITKEWLNENCICNYVHATKQKRSDDKRLGIYEYNKEGYDRE